MPQTPTSPFMPLHDGHSDHHPLQEQANDTALPIDPSIAGASPTDATHSQYRPSAAPPQDMSQGYQHPGTLGLYSNPRPDWGGYTQQPAGHITPGTGIFHPAPAAAAGQGCPRQVHSFVPIHGAYQHKRPRRRSEEIERIYKCGKQGCEKAYGTLNHLNAHVTIQGHGTKRIPEEFKEIRREWKAKKKEEEARKAAAVDEERQRQAAAAAAQNGGGDPQGPDAAHPPTTHAGAGKTVPSCSGKVLTCWYGRQASPMLPSSAGKGPSQPTHPVMQQGPYASYPHTPRTPATPNTPSSTGTMARYPPPPPQNGARGNAYRMMGNNAYPQQPYPGASSSIIPQTTTAASQPQPIPPAPATAGGPAPPVLRPMPTGGVMSQPGMNSPYGQLMPKTSMMPDGDQPAHVVGSQGRRGILPSAPGRPAAPAAGSAQAKTQIPQKDAEGKFPCPHCTKTYLHGKHLKRHLFRHAGDRPYMCVLCHDTFSRSDILKRHFIKCSVRRGNPTGASHLSNPQVHVKKNAAAQQKAVGAEGDVSHINGMGNMPADGMVHPLGIIPASDGMTNVANDQSQLSRSSSINRITDDANRDRRSMTQSVMGASTRPGSFDPTYNGGEVANNMTANIDPQLANYSMQQNQNGLPMFGASGSTDWSHMFQAGTDTDCNQPRGKREDQPPEAERRRHQHM